MAQNPARKHHFVPKLLLRPWLIQGNLYGYYFDINKRQLQCRILGLDGFCYGQDLWSFKTDKRGKDAIEREFFGPVDTKGAAARTIILYQEPAKLTEEQRCDFARLLLSLDVRRPRNVNLLRKELPNYYAMGLDQDPVIQAALAESGIDATPSRFLEDRLGRSLEDRALSIIPKLVDNPKVGEYLINAHWGVKGLRLNDGSLVLADRPLIRMPHDGRMQRYDSPHAIWILPLTPGAAFIAANSSTDLDDLLRRSGQRFVEDVNKLSAMQAERYVFSIEDSHKRWLCKALYPTME